MEADRGAARIGAARLALAAGLIIFGLKGIAWYQTGSVAVLSDALESVVNVVAALLLLASLRIALRPADRTHPYGHGKIEFFSAGVEGALIAIAAVVIAVEAIRNWRGDSAVVALDLGVALMVGASAVNAWVGIHLIRLGRRTDSLALEADGHHLLSDVATSVGVVGGLVALWLTGAFWIDGLVALCVAAHILWVGWKLVRRAVGGLMDEADLALLTRIANRLEVGRRHSWIDAHGLRAWRSGPVSHADLHLVVPRFFDTDRLHEVGDEVQRTLFEGAEGGEAIVHFDPCRPRYCAHCSFEVCEIRERAFEHPIALSVARVTRESDEETSP